ncbi:MAG: hypothetical protein J1F39_04290 [Clostridiales bacterium]|nr:hypothetical protein [Clostridiales bacterium]
MSFKNALKNLVAHFGVVWSLFMFILLFVVVITGLSLPFLLPIRRALSDAGVFESVQKAFEVFFTDGNFQALFDGLSNAYNLIEDLLINNKTIMSLSIWFFVAIMLFVFRFFLGLYEIPLATVLDGQLSCNSRYGFAGKFFSTLLMSIRYSFFKMLITITFDAAIFWIVYAIRSVIPFGIGQVFLILFVLFVLFPFRFSIVACWAPAAVNGNGVLKGFVVSIKIGFKRFGSIFSSFLVSMMLIIAIGVFITVFTLGVGLVIILPMSACYVSYLNITVYYNKTGRRYYIDGAVFTPPIENVL